MFVPDKMEAQQDNLNKTLLAISDGSVVLTFEEGAPESGDFIVEFLSFSL